MLGDQVETALRHLGVTPDEVERWLGQPCNCKERKEKLNQLDRWARRILARRLEGARRYLQAILRQE